MSENTFFRKASNWMGVLLIAYMIFRILFYHFEIIAEFNLAQIRALEFVVMSALASAYLIGVSFIFDRGSINRKILLYIGFSYLLRLLGEIICTYNELILGKEPFPSIADILHLLAYIPILLGIVIKVRSNNLPPEKLRLLFSFFLILVYSAVTTYFVVIPIIEVPGDLFEAIISLIYPVLDIVLLIAVSILIPKYAGGRMEKAWMFIALSLFIKAIADSLFAYEIWKGIYDSSSWVDDFMIWSYLPAIIFAVFLRDTFKH